MATYLTVMFFVLGAVVGSFLNVVIYRFHTGKSLGGRSHCLSCGKTLSWSELLPVVSYLAQRGICRECGAYIPPRYLVVEVLTGLSFTWVWHLFANAPVLLVFYLVLVSILVVIVFYDIRHTIIPNELTAAVLALALVFTFFDAFTRHDVAVVLSRLIAGASAGFFFYGLWYVSRGRWIGFGDAKLAVPLGMMVGLGGVFSMLVFSFWVGAVITLALLGLERLLRRGKARLQFLGAPLTIKSEVPFAPFLVLGFLIVQFFHADIFDITYLVFFP
ncbi:MAG TPA: prepilin peptidase [Candidatus Paceibacterota bacterium]|nr:prepilin peptidase [Candidatus Paceibacterota bacterium]